MAKYEDVKARSATGLAHAVEKKVKLVLDIRIHPATVLIPETGIYTQNGTVLVADLGLLTLKTVDKDKDSVTAVSKRKIDVRKILPKIIADRSIVLVGQETRGVDGTGIRQICDRTEQSTAVILQSQ
jgi:hypothetical protein